MTNHVIACREQNGRIGLRMKYWELISDNLKKTVWSLDYISAIDCDGRTI